MVHALVFWVPVWYTEPHHIDRASQIKDDLKDVVGTCTEDFIYTGDRTPAQIFGACVLDGLRHEPRGAAIFESLDDDSFGISSEYGGLIIEDALVEPNLYRVVMLPSL